jgi:hypothetical protein
MTRVACPKCKVTERPEGRPLCNQCLGKADRQLVARWFNRKRQLRKAQRRQEHYDLALLIERLDETTRELADA